MKRFYRLPIYGILAVLLFASAAVRATEIRVAVASNFSLPARAIASRFEAQSGHRVVLVSGATGKHYAQIINGAPFAVFLAADIRRPELLEQQGLALPGTRVTYAVGRLVLWSPRPGYVDREGRVLEEGGFRYLAIANPALAPYGKAAQEVLERRGLWDPLQTRMVRGENIGQAFQMVMSENAQLGFVAWSQISRPGHEPRGSWWDVPDALYTPVQQQAVLLQDTDAARAFLDYLQGDEARRVIGSFGYTLP